MAPTQIYKDDQQFMGLVADIRVQRSKKPKHCIAGPSSSSKKPKRFEIKKWSAVAPWAWDIVVDNCAICRNHIMDICIECQANQASATSGSFRMLVLLLLPRSPNVLRSRSGALSHPGLGILLSIIVLFVETISWISASNVRQTRLAPPVGVSEVWPLEPLGYLCAMWCSAGPSSSSKKPKRFEIKKWSAVTPWAWDIVVDNCAICRNHIMDICIECQVNQASATSGSFRSMATRAFGLPLRYVVQV
ncbi:hypothetical protein LWI29_014079 [Acer saccharum]|uniref:Uncharacterized protein n=1 Tax=Acer saccharum TaxID=4024 RepID=A0AA39VVL5_ACESA|nr:hypothetical protein LWI29_014079 [Acer saccharum]